MKLIGAIAVLIVLATACQKEEIRPNTPSNSAATLRSESETGTIEDEGTIGDASGSGITDPNDANRTNRNPKPKQ